MSETGFIPGVPFFSQVKILYSTHFLNFFACKNSTTQHTFSTHHTQYTTTHSIRDPQYISTAHHITSHHLTSHHMAPHYTTSQHITLQHITPHYVHNTPHSTTAQTRLFVVSLGLRVWCWCMGGVCFVFVLCVLCVSVCGLHRSRVGFCGLCLPCGLCCLWSCVASSSVSSSFLSSLSSCRCCVVSLCSVRHAVFWCTHQHGITREVSLPTLLCGVCFVSLVW